MTDDLLVAVRDLPRVCPYLHVPAQSGCDDVLRRMKRNYTVDFYREMLARCREIGDSSQFLGTFRPGDPRLIFGLYGPGN